MDQTAQGRAGARRGLRPILAGAAVVVAASIFALGGPSLSSSATWLAAALRGGSAAIQVGEADGLVPNGASVFDDRTPAVANLESGLLDALRRAAKAAARDGVELRVNSGWRSAEYQEQLFRDAVATYGSESEAARWVATARTSPHVSGKAVDIGPAHAAAWLSEHGARYGLCQIYRNEPWHFELRPTASSRGCPRMYPDSAHDPRMEL